MPAIRKWSIAVFVVVVGMAQHHGVQTVRAQCVPTKTKPQLDAMQVVNVASVEARVVANMAGYVHLIEDNSYLPLDITLVSIEENAEFRNVTLEGPCTKFRVDLAKLWEGQYSYKHFEMFIKDSVDGDDSSYQKICEFNKRFEFAHESSFRFSCKLRLGGHQCSDKQTKKLRAKLELASFELELDGDPELVELGDFGKEPWIDSCLAWLL